MDTMNETSFSLHLPQVMSSVARPGALEPARTSLRKPNTVRVPLSAAAATVWKF